ncbi:fatty acid desaturase family protein [Syntrophorhabdus aromaticivorans]|uniref:fatty acid desaturase family protein n=1 Tax=Syntrophorhabdus aromaticivorans TaxID=328301 RepID=UPI000A0167B6|nr:acyl-CoA desaturase [Syntrophorhabdus aromaticivorans]
MTTRLEHSTPTLTFNNNTEFQAALRRRIDDYFRQTGRPRRGNWQIYLKAFILLSCFFFSYLALVFVATDIWEGMLFAVLLALSMTGIGFNLMHDGGHRAFSEHRWINRLAAMTLDLIGASSYVWHWKHAMFHHNYVNITGHDPDIDLGIFARFAPHQKRLPFHRWQHLYIWVLYALLVFKFHFYSDFHHVITGRIHTNRMPRPKGRDLAIFVGGKVLFVVLAFALPLRYHPLSAVLFYYAVVVLIMGLPISVVFQLPHCTGRADHPLPDATLAMKNPWAVHQAEVTLDFDRHSPIRTWFFGGLNFHLEHHLFPSICHINYPGMSKIVEETCREFGVKYAEHRSFWTGLREHYRWLREMGRPSFSNGPHQH